MKSKSVVPSPPKERDFRSQSQTAQNIDHLTAKITSQTPQKGGNTGTNNLRIGANLKRISATDVVSSTVQ